MMNDRVRGLTRHLLVLGFSAGIALHAGAEGPIRSWTVDFDDPAEPGRWQLLTDQHSNQVSWRLVSATTADMSGRWALQFEATSSLGVETHVHILRSFPPDFHPRGGRDLVLEWEWKIGDVTRSDEVAFFFVSQVAGNVRYCHGISSHTRFTSGWPVLFEPGQEWRRHRIAIPSRPCAFAEEAPEKHLGLLLNFVNPIDQVVRLAALRVEEWPAGTFDVDPIFRPHRPARARAPFEALPVTRLQFATAGALEDLDGDGLPELLVLERQGHAHLYRNDGAGAFRQEITRQAGLDVEGLGTGAMFLDLDGDRDLDLTITSEFDVPRLFENVGGSRFRARPPVSDQHLSFWYGMASADVDRDGDPDLLAVSPLEPSFLFLRNLGDWRFLSEELFDPSELIENGRLSFSASFADLDADGYPELFLGREYLLRNDRGRLVPELGWWPAPSRIKSEGGVWADLTGDGLPDLLVLRDDYESLSAETQRPAPGSDLFDRRTKLLAGTPAGGFRDITSLSNLPTLDSAEVALIEDFDNDGHLDLYICQRDGFNFLLLNDGRARFEDHTELAGLGDSGGCDSALAGDLDGDGGMDVVILSYGAAPRFLFNELARGAWTGVVVGGRRGATEAIGARVRLLDRETGAPFLTRFHRRGRGFGSVGPRELRFGLADRTEIDVEVRFPRGNTRFIERARSGSTLYIREQDETLASSLRGRVAEIRWPMAARVRRTFSPASSASLLVALPALLVGLWSATASSCRSLAVSTLLASLGATFFISVPGEELRSIFGIWCGGALSGWLLPNVARVGSRFFRRTGRTDIDARREDLVRFARDFRHAGMESRDLLSIEIRVKNLFWQDELDPRLYRELSRRAEGFLTGSAPRIRRLAQLATDAWPDLRQPRRLSQLLKKLERSLAELPSSADERSLRSWRESTLPFLVEMRQAISDLLEQIDVRNSCDVGEVLRELDAVKADERAAKGLQIRIQPGDARRLRAAVPHDRLLWILENLFSNASVALESSQDKQITISVDRLAGRIEIRFVDTGPGVPSDLATEIFKPGFTTKRDSRGYGLSRSREILDLYQGTLSLENSPPGACFLITVPAVGESP